MVGEQRGEWRGRYDEIFCISCLIAVEEREDWGGRYDVTLCSYCLMAGDK